MKTKTKRFVLILTVLVLAALACSLPFELPSLGGSSALGEEYRSEDGGFTFKRLKDYTLDDSWGVVYMEGPGEDSDMTPVIQIVGSNEYFEFTNIDEFFSELENQILEDATVSSVKNYRVDGVNGKLVEVSFLEEADGRARGKIFIAIPYEGQAFLMMGASHEDEWPKFEKLFDAVLKSVKFHEVIVTP